MTAVHQFVPSYAGRGAIGNHTLEVGRALRHLGVRTLVYVGDARDVPTHDVRPYQTYRKIPGEATWLLYQLSIGHPMADFLAWTYEPLMLNYHNVTPEGFMRPWEPLLAPQLRMGRRQLASLAERTQLAIAVSEYNEAELASAGYRATTTVPVLVDYEALGAQSDRETTRRLRERKRGGGADWLFVGRLTPNKAQHRLIQALAAFRRLYDPRARLWLVGGSASHRYETALRDYIADLGLAAAVTLTGSVPQPVLVSHFQNADVYVSVSEHEGFGIPLVEALWHRLPVVALGSSGVPATVGEGALVLQSSSPPLVAGAVNKVLTDGDLLEQLVKAGESRVADLSLEVTRPRFEAAVASTIGL